MMAVGNPVDFGKLLEGVQELKDLDQERLKTIIEACVKNPGEIVRLEKLLDSNPFLLQAILMQIPVAFQKQPQSSVQFVFACVGVAAILSVVLFQGFSMTYRGLGYKPASTGNPTSILDVKMGQ